MAQRSKLKAKMDFGALFIGLRLHLGQSTGYHWIFAQTILSKITKIPSGD